MVMSESEKVCKSTLKNLDNLVHGFVESVAHEHEHQIDHLKETPSFAAGNNVITEFTNQPESTPLNQLQTQTQQLPTLKENQLLEETITTTSRFSDFSFLPERSVLTESAKSLMIDSYELANDTLAVVRVPPKSKRLFSAALLVANATHRSVNSLVSSGFGSDDIIPEKDTKTLPLPIGFNESAIANALPTAVNKLKKQKKSRGTSRLNAVLKETSAEEEEETIDHRLKMLQRRLDRIPKKRHQCRESNSGCSVDDPLMFNNCTKMSESVVRDNLNNIITLENLNITPNKSYTAVEINDSESEEDDEEVVIRNEDFQNEDYGVLGVIIETEITDKQIMKNKKKKKNNVLPLSLFRATVNSNLEVDIEKRERFLKEYIRVATLAEPNVVVSLYCRWNPRLSVACGQTTELIMYTMKAFFTTNSGLHVNWIHSPEEQFERFLERGARMKFRKSKDYPVNVTAVLALSRDASILLKNPNSKLLRSLSELLGISKNELAVVEINV
ncbi:uncharacterized protein [Antedon mediterranea]|uniref:uncharacterized protein n=1 Tax=Antedon mediterranea TaxID=105859 RepID=UPI003AF8E19A